MTQQENKTPYGLLIFSLSLLTFVLGTSEFVIVGILTDISSSLHISNAQAGTLVSAFAFTFAITTPIVMALTSHFKKRPWMLLLILAFVLFNTLSIFATSYVVLLILRMLTAIVTGVLISLAMVVANESVPEHKRGMAISFVFGGFTLANVIGVPIGTLLAGHFSWHATFILTASLGLVAFIFAQRLLPHKLSQEKGSIRYQFALLGNSRILMAFFIPALGFGATYAVFTYLVPILKTLDIQNESISLVLFGYGVISIFSNILAGKIASHRPIARLRIVFFIQALVLIAIYWTTASLPLALVNIGLMSLMSILLTTSTQLYLIDLAKIYQPSATGLAASLMPVASNVGIAMGSAIGGFVYHASLLTFIPFVGGVLAILACILTSISYRLDQKSK